MAWDEFPSQLRSIYTFCSDAVRSEALLVLFHEDSAIETEIVDVGRGREKCPEIDTNEWTLDSTAAFQLAQEYGGREYLEENSGVEITLYLEHQKRFEDDSPVMWRVSYLRTGDGNRIDVEVDAITGELIAIIR